MLVPFCGGMRMFWAKSSAKVLDDQTSAAVTRILVWGNGMDWPDCPVQLSQVLQQRKASGKVLVRLAEEYRNCGVATKAAFSRFVMYCTCTSHAPEEGSLISAGLRSLRDLYSLAQILLDPEVSI
jgi:hypothetical protein